MTFTSTQNIFCFVSYIYIYCIYNNHFWNTFFSILPGALKKIDKLVSLLDNAHNYLNIWVRYPKEMDLYTVITHIFLSIFNRENKSWARLLYKSFLQKNYFFFVYFHSFQTFLKEFSLTRAGPNFEFASKFFFFLQTKYKITRHTRTFICDMPIALILRPKEAEVF